MIGLDILGARVGDGAGSTLSQVFDVAHPIGKGILSAFGAGGVADVLAPLEQKGIEATMSPEEKAKAAKKREAEIQAKVAAVQAQQQQTKAAGGPWRTAAYIVGGIAVFVVAGKLVFGGRR
jgi:hypothetical protein